MKGCRGSRSLRVRSWALAGAVVLAAALLTVTLQAYERLPTQRPPILSDVPRRMEVNHLITRLLARGVVVDFYTTYTGRREVTEAILDAALAAEVPVNLAFALGWQESRFDARAVSEWNEFGTRDWGLFQLNDGTRAHWKREEFFNIDRNAEHGMQYLRECLAEMGSVDLALAAYNAGIRGVREWGVPRATRAYTIAILAYERELDRAFGAKF